MSGIDLNFKLRLHKHCVQLLAERIEANKKAMTDAQESANSEEKSSAGDKYETGRAMSQIQRDMSARQLKTAMDESANLKKSDPSVNLKTAINGALILTDASIIYIAAAIGMINFENHQIAVVSQTSPIAITLKGKTEGSSITVAGKSQTVKKIL